ncbi:hypothetical protein ACKWTF_007165 [Chironomus riparius]
MNGTFQDEYMRGLPLGLCQDEYRTCQQLCDLIDSASPVLGLKLVNLLKVFENSSREVKKDLHHSFKFGLNMYDRLVNAREKLNECLTLLPTLKIRMNAFWDSVNEKHIISCTPIDYHMIEYRH